MVKDKGRDYKFTKSREKIASALEDKICKLGECSTVSDVYTLVQNTVEPLTEKEVYKLSCDRLLSSIRESKDVKEAMFAVTDFYLKGKGLDE